MIRALTPLPPGAQAELKNHEICDELIHTSCTRVSAFRTRLISEAPVEDPFVLRRANSPFVQWNGSCPTY